MLTPTSQHLKQEGEQIAVINPSVLAGGRNMNLGKRESTRGSNARAALFDGMEEGGLRAGTSFSTSEIAEQENERGLDTLADRVSILKRITTDIHNEAESHHSLLDQMEWGQLKETLRLCKGDSLGCHLNSAQLGLDCLCKGSLERLPRVEGPSLNESKGRNMDGARGMLSGTVDRMTKVFQTKSGRQILTIVASCVAVFLLVYFLRR